MTSEEIELVKLDLERQRLAIEQSKAALEGTFLRRNAGVLISAAVSFAAVIVSVAQVWMTTIQRDKELALSSLQQRADSDAQTRQRERELAVTESQRRRELDLAAARFFMENQKAIFSGTAEEQELYSKIIPTIFPADVASTLLLRIQRSTTGPEREIWAAASRAATTQFFYDSLGNMIFSLAFDLREVVINVGGAALRKLQIGKDIMAVNVSSDRARLTVMTSDGEQQEWEIRTGRRLR